MNSTDYFVGVNDTVDWTGLFGNDSGSLFGKDDGGNETPSAPWKAQKIAAVVLSVIAILANLSSIMALAKVRGRLTSNLR